MSFFEVEFPKSISYLAVGGAAFSTNVNDGFSGFEQRNRNWALSRGKWSVSLQTPSSFDTNRQGFIDLLNAFFLNVGAKADAFRLKDHADFKFTAQQIGVGDGVKTAFQLIKTYAIGGRSYIRTIKKPVWHTVKDYQGNALADTVKIYLNAAPTSAFTLDEATGLVTMTAPPGNTVVVTADGEFHYPVRFDTDELGIQMEESDVSGGKPIASWNSIQLVEVRI